MKVLKIFFAAALTLSMVACSPSGTMVETTPSQTPGGTPSFTFTPISTPTEKPVATPTPVVEPTATPDVSDEYYIYTIHGVGENSASPYPWEGEAVEPVTIKYGTSGSDTVRLVQERLTKLGFYCSVANGTYNSKTRTALNDFQTMIGMEKTEDITPEVLEVLFDPKGIPQLAIEEFDITEGILDGFTVFIDAGHGGDDTGTARGSLVERTVVIDQSYRIATMLEKAGARVIMTRIDNTKVALSYRSALTNYVVLTDMKKDTEKKIELVRAQMEERLTYAQMDATELSQNADTLRESIVKAMTEKMRLDAAVKAALDGYGSDSDEYKDALAALTEYEAEIEKLNARYQLVRQMYFSLQLNVDLDDFIEKFRIRIAELEEYRDKIEYYMGLFDINIENPTTEFEGLYVKTYDENGFKIIEPELAEIMDITGAFCENKYAFLSIHVNSVDNAPNVSGTEIYVRNKNTSNNNYGINRYYYQNYNAEERSALAGDLKTAFDEVNPMGDNKASVIKDQDLFVLREMNVPGILLEMGYSTNDHDRLAMMTPNVRNKFAYGIYQGLMLYYLG